MYYIQFREGDAYLYTEEKWFSEGLLPNMRRAKIDTNDEKVAQKSFDELEIACRKANPTIDWANVSDTVQEF